MAAEVIAELRAGRIIPQSHKLKRALGLSHKVIQKILNRIRSRARIAEVSNSPRRREPVSYTHLTLPTIYSV